jgi:hypothetical protein
LAWRSLAGQSLARVYPLVACCYPIGLDADRALRVLSFADHFPCQRQCAPREDGRVAITPSTWVLYKFPSHLAAGSQTLAIYNGRRGTDLYCLVPHRSVNSSVLRRPTQRQQSDMGLLSLGTPLDWPETKKLANHIRHHGITQFLYTWDRWVGKKGEPLLWGDEVGCSLGIRSANPLRVSGSVAELGPPQCSLWSSFRSNTWSSR